MTVTRMCVALSLVLGMLAAPAPAASATARRTALRHALHAVVAAGVPGAVLLARDGRRTIRLASGHGDLRPSTPMRAGDRFRIGSITKPFVATVVLQLDAERKLGLE